jgi:hypothetical protein
MAWLGANAAAAGEAAARRAGVDTAGTVGTSLAAPGSGVRPAPAAALAALMPAGNSSSGLSSSTAAVQAYRLPVYLRHLVQGAG